MALAWSSVNPLNAACAGLLFGSALLEDADNLFFVRDVPLMPGPYPWTGRLFPSSKTLRNPVAQGNVMLISDSLD